MKYAQQLYENGLITYMRTDSKTYSVEFINESKKYILKNYNDEKYISHNIDSLTVSRSTTLHSQEAHEAIRPISLFTKIETVSGDLDAKAVKLYKIIWTRSLESCMSPCIIYYINAEISAYSNLSFKHKSEEIFFHGWKIVTASNKNKTEQNKIYNYLLSFNQKNKVEYNKITSTVIVSNKKLHLTEAMLVHLLEEKGIGRPSTYSSLVDKIQERGYVKKENVVGEIINCSEFILEGDELTQTDQSREFGAEKNKLVIQPLGILVIEYLINKFDLLFNYDYTKNMEEELDVVSNGEKEYYRVCSLCYENLCSLTTMIPKEKYNIKIDDNHFYMIGKYGPVIKQESDNIIKFLPVKKDIDLKKLEAGLYSLSDLLQDTASENNILLGKYDGTDLYLKNGKYGIYAQWGDNKIALKELNKTPFNKITLIDVLKYLEKDNTLNPNKQVGLVRTISPNISIRNGQYGDYIFYKTNKMKKPQFFKLNDFKEDYKKCNNTILKEWLKVKYSIE